MTSHDFPLRMLAVTGLALVLSGCYVHKDTAGDIPNDYRKRHPITLKEGEKTVEIFVGSNRGGLTEGQGANVLYFAKLWKRESTGGIVIDVPAGNSERDRRPWRIARSALDSGIGRRATAFGEHPAL